MVTVAVCTMGRPKDLNECLTSLVRQSVDRTSYEILVVDNGRSEDVAQIVGAFQGSGVAIRYAREPRLGISYARRRAWKSALGAVVAFIDDDAVAHPAWVTVIAHAFSTCDPSVVLIGGPVNNVRGLVEPWPFTDSPGPSGLDLGTHFREVSSAEHLWGCNVAMRRSVLADFDAFGEFVGPRGKRPGANEDILIQKQVELAGLKRAYDPRMQIVHNSWRATASNRQKGRLAFHTGVDNSMMDRLLEANSLAGRADVVRGRIARVRAQLAADFRARRSGDSVEAQRARLAALQSIGTIWGQLWPPFELPPKPDQ